MTRAFAFCALGTLAAGCGGLGGLGSMVGLGPSYDTTAMENAQRQQQDAMINFTFRPGWKNLIDVQKFKSALAYIDAKKDEIGETNQKLYVEETHRESKTWVDGRITKLRRHLQDCKSQKDVAALKSDDFAYYFSFPPPDELLSPGPAYAWARSSLIDFEDFRSRKPNGETLLRPAIGAAALPPDDDGENRLFDAVEQLAFAASKDSIRADVDLALNAPKADRESAVARAKSLLAKWADFVKALPADGKPRAQAAEHEAALGKPLAELPRDLPELDGIDVSTALAADQPEQELRKLERTLRGLESKAPLTREARQKLYTLLVTVVALRNFQAGREEPDAVAELKGVGEKLKSAGGPAGDTRQFGARVQGVFDAVLR